MAVREPPVGALLVFLRILFVDLLFERLQSLASQPRLLDGGIHDVLPIHPVQLRSVLGCSNFDPVQAFLRTLKKQLLLEADFVVARGIWLGDVETGWAILGLSNPLLHLVVVLLPLPLLVDLEVLDEFLPLLLNALHVVIGRLNRQVGLVEIGVLRSTRLRLPLHSVWGQLPQLLRIGDGRAELDVRLVPCFVGTLLLNARILAVHRNRTVS